MITALQPSGPLERVLACLLAGGTWIASALIAVGLGVSFISTRNGSAIVSGGVVLLICLPVTRVAVMGLVFLYRREFLLGSVAAAVLSVLAASFWLAA